MENSEAYRRWGVAEAMVELAWALRYDDPHRAEELCRFAVSVAERLDGDIEGDLALADLRARCYGYLANFLRSNESLVEAMSALESAKENLLQGTGAVDGLAFYLEVRASLCGVLERFREGRLAAEMARLLYLAIGKKHLAGRSTMNLAFLYAQEGQHEQEIRLVREAMSLVDPSEDARLALAGWHNLLWSLHECGNSREALALLSQARPLYLSCGDRVALVHLQWLEGMIARSLDRPDQAEGCFQEARKRFIEQGIPIDAALVSLDLAGLLSQQRRHSEVLRLATEMLAVFKAHRVEKEALAAYLLLHQAAERKELTAALLREVERRLDQVRQSG
ncbi:MAG: hypothetical protein AAF481_17670 [Acidobacteriota bacterium]